MSLEQQLVEALQTLYFADDAAKKQAANRWLEEFQKTPEAWMLADRLLNAAEGTTGLELQVFGAQTIRTKITYDLGQLDAAAQASLRDSLLGLLCGRFAKGPRAITTQLCLSLASLALQLEHWQGAFGQVVDGLQAKGMSSVLLEFLTVLPEEVRGNSRITVPEGKANAFAQRATELLTANVPQVLQLLMAFLQQQSAATHADVFRCLLSWVKSNDITLEHLLESPIVAFTFQALRSEELFEIACDVLCQIIKEAGNLEKTTVLAAQVLDGLAQLLPMLEECSSEENEERQRGLCRVFVEAGEELLPLLVPGDPSLAEKYFVIVRGVLKCTAFTDLDVVPITFNFWFELTRALIEEKAVGVKPKYLDVYRKLVEVMIQHLRFPNENQPMSAEERDEFREFRHVMGDVLKDCCVVFGDQEALSKPYQLLVAYLSQNPVTAAWQDIEAPLFSLRSLGSEVSETENVVMPQIMTLLQNLPEHPKIRYAATLVLGRYSEWTRNHPDFIAPHLTYICAGFSHKDVSAAAALSLKYLCQSCGPLMVNYLEQLHPFYMSAISNLPQYDALELTEAIVHILNAVPFSQLLAALQTFCLPIAQKLHALASTPVDGDNSAVVKELEAYLDRFNVFLRHIKPKTENGQQHPCIGLLQEMWSIFELILQNYGNTALAEVLCKCFKNAIVTYDQLFLPLLSPFLSLVSAAYTKTGQPCYLWVLSHAVRRFAKSPDPAIVQAFVDLFQGFTQLVVSQLTSPQSFDEYPDGTLFPAWCSLFVWKLLPFGCIVVEDYFHLVATYARTILDVFLSLPAPFFATLMRLVMMGMECQHTDCIERVFWCLRDMFQLQIQDPPISAASQQTLVQLGGEYAAVIVGGIVRGIAGTRQCGIPFSVGLLQPAAAVWFYWTGTVGLAPGQATLLAALNELPEQRMSVAAKNNILELYKGAMETNKIEKLRYVLSTLHSTYHGTSRSAAPPRRKLEF